MAFWGGIRNAPTFIGMDKWVNISWQLIFIALVDILENK